MGARRRRRLSRVALSAIAGYAPLWRKFMRPSGVSPQTAGAAQSALADDEVHALGWVQPRAYVPLALHAVREEIVPGLRAIGLELPETEIEALLAPPSA
jgi:hypothetical protein